MENIYETVILIDENLNKEDYLKELDKIKNYFKNCEILKIEELGLRKLAYEIRKNKNAYYVVITFRSKCEEISEIERLYRIDDNILKFIVVRRED